MKRPARGPRGFDEEGLDVALSSAALPAVPGGLADRIVTAVTALPQEKPGQATEARPTHGSPGARRALAASIAAAVVLGAGASSLWFAPEPGPPGGRADPAVAAAVVPVAGERREDAVAVAAAGAEGSRSVVEPPSGGAGRPAATLAEPGNANTVADTPPESGAPGEPDASPAGDASVLLAGQGQPPAPGGEGAAPEEVAGTALAEGPIVPPAPDGPVYGPPATQGLGIAGGGPSTSPGGQPSGPRPTNGPIGGPTRR